MIEGQFQDRQKSRDIAERSTARTDRNADTYQEFLGFSLKELKGKFGLDIGSGENELFSKQAAALGVKVFSMSPRLRKGIPNDYLKKDWQKRSVAGRAQEIPFLDNTFDFEFALYSVPYYLPVTFEEFKTHQTSFEEYTSFISEVIRTLKSGGSAHIYPIYGQQLTITKEILKKFSQLATYTLTCIQPEKNPLGSMYRLVLTKKH